MNANVYIETSINSPAKKDGEYIAILEAFRKNGEPVTITVTGCEEQSTQTRLTLLALADGLRKIRSGTAIKVYASCRQIRAAMDCGWLEEWEGRGWKRTRNADLWEQIIGLREGITITWAEDGEQNTYRSYLQTELKARAPKIWACYRAQKGEEHDKGR